MHRARRLPAGADADNSGEEYLAYLAYCRWPTRVHFSAAMRAAAVQRAAAAAEPHSSAVAALRALI
eukprot:6351008-Prymnesium_polylepis.1